MALLNSIRKGGQRDRVTRNSIKLRVHGCATYLLLLSVMAQAQLPTPVNPSSGAPNGNYLAFMEGWTGDPDWGSVGLTAVIAGALLAIVSFFLNEAVGII
jgi:hypothetical protein